MAVGVKILRRPGLAVWAAIMSDCRCWFGRCQWSQWRHHAWSGSAFLTVAASTLFLLMFVKIADSGVDGETCGWRSMEDAITSY